MKRRALAGAAALALVASSLGLVYWQKPKSAQSSAVRGSPQRPPLLLLTSLPIQFGERFGLEGPTSPVQQQLSQRYEPIPIAATDTASLARGPILLMAHPRAQTAENLAELDQWIRDGGRLVLLADPQLDWQSERPLGDRLRPPPDFADTGLLANWGLTLSGATIAGEHRIRVEQQELVVSAAGTIRARNRRCQVSGGGFVARCQIGDGAVTVIADADFVMLADHRNENLDLLARELARLAR